MRGCLLDRQFVFRIALLIRFPRQAERFAKYSRLHPSALLARGRVAVGGVAENVERWPFGTRIDDPVLPDAGTPVQFPEPFVVFHDGASANDFEDHVGGAFEFDVVPVRTSDEPDSASSQALSGKENAV